MTVTSTQSKVPASVTNFAVGRYLDDGTAAAFKITTGFRPRYVLVVNVGSGLCKMEWFEGMTAAHGIRTVTAGDITVITSLGITVAADGFTVGLDLELNADDEQLSWLAIG